MVDVIKTSDLHHGWTSNTAKKMERFFDEIVEAHGDDFVLCVCGDLITAKQESFKKCLKLLRRKFSKARILVIRGNHDFYDYNYQRGMTQHPYKLLDDVLIRHREIAKELDIILLEPGVQHVEDGVLFVGFDGWHYDKSENSVLVKSTFPKSTYEKLLERGIADMNKILSVDTSNYRKSVCLTHFPPYQCTKEDPHVSQEGYLPLTQKFDYILSGHTHREHKEELNGCLMINAGSGAQFINNSVKEQWRYTHIVI